MFDDDVSDEDISAEALAAMFRRSREKDRAALDDFELLSVIGKGTFGRVFLARHRHSERLVALKMLSKARCAEARACGSRRSGTRG